MAKGKEKEELIELKEDEVQIVMSLSEDRKVFVIQITSGTAMSDGEVVLALESFLYENILETGQPDFAVEH